MVGVWWVCSGCVVGVWWVCGGCVVGVWWVCGGCYWKGFQHAPVPSNLHVLIYAHVHN